MNDANPGPDAGSQMGLIFRGGRASAYNCRWKRCPSPGAIQLQLLPFRKLGNSAGCFAKIGKTSNLLDVYTHLTTLSNETIVGSPYPKGGSRCRTPFRSSSSMAITATVSTMLGASTHLN